MNTLIVYLCSSLCLLIYIPAVLAGVREITDQRATINLRMRRFQFTGTSAMLFGAGQTLGGVMCIIGVILAVQNYNLLYIPLFVILGGVVSLGGFWLARKTAVGEYEMDMTPRIDLNSFIMRNIHFQQEQQEQPADYVDDDDVITLSPDDVTVIDDDEPDNQR
jgi:cytochrome c biogenesis protein CcdA